MAGPNWIPVAVLPNLFTRRTVEGEIVALVPPSDMRVTTFASEHPMLGDFLARFTDTFYVPLEPVVFIVRDDAIPKFNDTQGALLSFRDLVALSVVPHARSNGLVYGGTDRISYANSFWLHPWIVESDRLVASTPAFSGFHVVRDFHGQSSPELPLMQLSELDEPLFAASLARWKRHYLRKRQRWQDRALFRSLNMAYQAAQLPAGKGPTLYDLGRVAALWVSAFEILAHPRVDSSGLKYVYALFDRATYLDRKVRRKKYAAYAARAKKPWPRRTLPCWLYGRLYRGRNLFLHGNPVSPKTLQPRDLKVSLFWLAPCLFRLALTGAWIYRLRTNCAKAPPPSKLASSLATNGLRRLPNDRRTRAATRPQIEISAPGGKSTSSRRKDSAAFRSMQLTNNVGCGGGAPSSSTTGSTTAGNSTGCGASKSKWRESRNCCCLT